MNRRLVPVLAVLALVCSAIPSAQAQHIRLPLFSTPIQHIVFIVKENHTFDSMFGLFPGVNGTTTGKIKANGKVSTIPLDPAPDAPANFCHEWSCAHTAVDNGLMDAFNKPSKGCKTAPYTCYIEANQGLIPNYWQYAQQYVLGDNMFSSEEAASYANHLFMAAEDPGGSPSDQLVLSADGAMVHGQWAEVKTLVIGEVAAGQDVGEAQCQHLSYFSRMSEASVFAEQATVETARRGVTKAKQVCAVMDGAEWIDGLVDLHRPAALRILDFPPAAQAVNDIGKAGRRAGAGGVAGDPVACVETPGTSRGPGRPGPAVC